MNEAISAVGNGKALRAQNVRTRWIVTVARTVLRQKPDWPWWEHAACAGAGTRDGDPFFPMSPNGERSSGDSFDSGRRWCARCPVISPCLAAALSEEASRAGLAFGLRGGVDPADRTLARAYNRGTQPGWFISSKARVPGLTISAAGVGLAAHLLHLTGQADRSCRWCLQLDYAGRHESTRAQQTNSAM